MLRDIKTVDSALIRRRAGALFQAATNEYSRQPQPPYDVRRHGAENLMRLLV